MANSFEEALAAVNGDPELKDKLMRAQGEAKRDVLQEAGITVPTQDDYDDYVASHGQADENAQIFMGGVDPDDDVDDSAGDDA